MFQHESASYLSIKHFVFFSFCLLIVSLTGCGPSSTGFAIMHILDDAGDQIAQTLEPEQYPPLDNTSGTAPISAELRINREFRYQIIERISQEGIDVQEVKAKIAQHYKLPPNNTEIEPQIANCLLQMTVPAGEKMSVTVEWTEQWAEGVINEGLDGLGSQIGTYRVFLGYTEPCSVVKTE